MGYSILVLVHHKVDEVADFWQERFWKLLQLGDRNILMLYLRGILPHSIQIY